MINSLYTSSPKLYPVARAPSSLGHLFLFNAFCFAQLMEVAWRETHPGTLILRMRRSLLRYTRPPCVLPSFDLLSGIRAIDA